MKMWEMLRNARRKQFNVSHTPLFPMIPLSRVVIDNLHLFLRVADVLIDLFIVELKRHDANEKVKKFSLTQKSSNILTNFRISFQA